MHRAHPECGEAQGAGGSQQGLRPSQMEEAVVPWALYPHSPLGQISQGWGGIGSNTKAQSCAACACAEGN